MRALVQKWSSTNRFIGLALVILSLLFGTVPMHAQPSPPNRPILFVHGWCGSAYDWAPLLSSLNLNTALSAIYPNKAEYIIEYNSVLDSYAYYQVSDQSGTPLATGPIQLFSLFGQEPIGSDARFFAIQFYDPIGQDTDPDNVARISILNKAYEIKKVVEKIKEITNPTGGVANAASVNIIAHSMGGLDARAYVENMASVGSCYDYAVSDFIKGAPDYQQSSCLPGTPQAAYANDVANIITLDTPHSGSPIATPTLLAELASSADQGLQCNAFESTNMKELLPESDGGAGLLEELNFIGSPNFGVTPSMNTVPIQAVANYIGDQSLSWLGIRGYSDEIVPLDSQAVPALGPHSAVVLPAPAQFSHTGSDWEVLSNLDCWVFIPIPELMLHSVRCLGALSDPQKEIATQLINDNMLWINSWSVTPSTISVNDPVKIGYSAVDSGSTTLSSVTLWKATDNNGQPGAWTNFGTQTLSGGTTASSTFTDNTITVAGTYYYVADMLDSANREARAPVVTMVTVSPVSTSGYTLTVNSTNPSSGVGITVSPADNNSSGNGTTSFVRTYNKNAQVTLTAPSTASGNSFSSWTGCDLVSSATCTVTLAASRTVTANYTTSTSPTLTAHFSYAQVTLGNGFNSPSGVAVDGSGNVYVADSGNNAVKEILAAGGYTSMRTLGSGFSSPSGVAVDGSGNVYVADSSNNAVKEILAAGGYATVRTLGSGFNFPLGVAVDGSGNVFVADAHNSAVKEILAAGGYTTVKVLGTGFNSPESVAVDVSDNVFVADDGNFVVKEILAAGGYTTVTTLASGFGLIKGVAVDGGDNVFVADDMAFRGVKEYLAASGYTTVKTFAPGLTYAFGVTVDGSGNVFACFPFSNNSVVEFMAGSANFGTVSIGQTSATIPFTFTFDTAGTLGSFAALTGGVTGLDFATATTGTCAANTAYAAGATCTVNVTFTPTLTGLRDGTVVLKDGNGNVIAAANVYGTGWTGSSTAPTEPVGTASGTQTATILFSSSFTLGSISVVTQGATGLDFNYVNGGTCTVGTAYTAGQICTVNYTFTPIAPGQRMGAIVITDGSGNVQATEYISGVGTGPEAVFAPGIISTVAGNGTQGYNGDGIAATSAELYNPWGGAVDSAGNIYIADYYNNRIRKLSASTGLISTVAGNGTQGYNGDGISATSAELYYPHGVAVDGVGNIYIADYFNSRIRKISARTGLISTVAGNGGNGYNGDGISATSAELYGPVEVEVDSVGNIYISEVPGGRIRKVNASTGIISTVAGNGTQGYNGDGIAATSAELVSWGKVAVDSAGNIYIADDHNHRIRRVSASTGLISTVAGNGNLGYSGDGMAATSAELGGLGGVALDGAGNIYIADYTNNYIRKVSASTGLISTVAGVNGSDCSREIDTVGDGCLATSAELDEPWGIVVDSTGNIYTTDVSSNRIRKISASTSSMSFASTAVGSTSSDSPQTVALWNNGNTALTLPIPSNGSNPSIASNFTLNSTGGTVCPLIGSTASSTGTLAVGASCTLPISFAPTAAGSISGSLVVTDNSMNGSNAMQTVSLSGTATQASQTITFTAPSSPVTYGVAPITLSASASSGLAVTFSVLSGPGTVSGSTLTITGVGTIVVAANQAGNSNYTEASQVTQSIVVNQAGVAAAPTFLPVAGTYTTPQTVTINDATTGATIYYTTNGTTPTTSSSVYSGAITVSSSETLEAFAIHSGYTNSAVASAGYTISPLAGGGALDWIWMGGSSTLICSNQSNACGQPGVYGTLGTPAAGNIPGSREFASSWTDSDGHLWLFGGNGNDLWEFNPSTNQWAWMSGSSTGAGQSGVYGTLGVPAAGNTPGSRSSATSWTDSSGNLWLFGGLGYVTGGDSGDLNDLWKFNPSTNLWAWMGGSSTYNQSGVYGKLGTPASGNMPGSRQDAMSWTDSSGNLWLFGGAGGSGNDLWQFNPSTNQWTWMGGSSSVSSQSGVYGRLGTPAAGNIPGSRSGAASWTDSRGTLWLFGGGGYDANGNGGLLNDLWEFNPSTNLWAWMGGSSTVPTVTGVYGQSGVYGTLGTPAAGNIPGGRSGAASWTDGSGNLWLFGGNGYDAKGNGSSLNDLWEFNPSTNQWTWMGGSNTANQLGVYGTLGTPAAGNIPGGRNSAASWTDSSDRLWLFGGQGYRAPSSLNLYNDLWVYQLPTTTPTVTVIPSFTSITPTQGLSVTVYVSAGSNNRTPTGSVILTGGGYTSPSTSLSSGSAPFNIAAGSLALGSDTFAASYTPDSPSSSIYSSATGSSPAVTVALPVTATPVFSVPAGSYSSTQMVSISDAMSGATIYYTTDGTTPTTSSTKYTAAITISSTETLEALALATGYSNSAVASASYLISPLAVGGILDWTWMGGSNTVNHLGVYGTLGTPAAGNIPGSRYEATSWTDSSGNRWLFGGVGYVTNGTSGSIIVGNLNDIWEFNPSTNQWAWMGGSSTAGQIRGVYGTLGTPAAGNIPGSRYGATSWTDGSGHLWLFGGWGYDANRCSGDLNDLWELNPTTNQWAWMGGSSTILCSNNEYGQPGVYGTLGTPAAGNVPGSRYEATSWSDSNGHLWLFGGFGYDANGNLGNLDDLWEFNPSTNLWMWMGGSSTVPQTTNGSGGNSGVYGTLGTPSAGNIPGSRMSAVSWTDSIGNLWLFGGNGYDANGNPGNLNDLWMFNSSTNQWAWMGGSSTVPQTTNGSGGNSGVYGTLGTPSAGNIPGSRSSAASWTDGSGNLWLFGGSGLNDLWEFYPSTNQWAWMGGSSTVNQSGVYGTLGTPAAGNIPGSRSSAASWTDNSGHLWLFGGGGYDANGNGGILNDFWEYQLPTMTPTVTVTPSLNSIPATQGLSVTAAVSAGSDSRTPTGSVILTGGGYTSTSTALSSGSATFNITAGSLSVGSYVFTASYTPDSSSSATYNRATGTSSAVTVTSVAPTITFTVPNHTYGDAPFTVSATSNSSGAITYSVVSGPATISSSTVTLTGAGSVVLQASQVAAGNYSAGTQTATVTVAKESQTITFSAPASPVNYGVAPITLSASASSGLAVAFNVVSGPGTISGSTLTITGAGTVVVAANQAGNTNYSAATQVTQSIVVNQATQTITFTAPTSPLTYGVSPITLVATGGASGNAVAFSVVSGPATISGSTLTITGAGTVVVAANQAGNTNYSAATQVTQTIVVNQATQTITFTAPTSPVTYGVSPITLVASSTSGLAVTFSVVSGPGTVSGSTLTITGVGTVVVAANQAGNTNYSAATQVTQSIVVNPIGVAATPTFSPVAGTYTAAQTVTISEATSGATIYYTTNGTTPTTSSNVYSGAITVSSTETLEAISTATGYSTSPVASAAYIINIPTNPVPAISGISPAFTNAGGSVFTLTVNGSEFIAGSTVYWGASALTTTYVSATQLTAQVLAADIATAGTIAITVQTPAPGGGTSNAWQFEVDSVSSGSTAPTITSTTETVAAGSTASYPVTVPSSVTSVSVTCLNLPTGASCSYSSATNTVTITTSSTTPKGVYQIIVVFTETVSGAASGFILLPILLLPLGFMRRKLAARGIWLTVCLGLVLLATAVLAIGCGGGSSGGSGSTTPPATHQVISSGAVSLTIQ